ncbi:rab-GTPase-TBC domain-containing protein [Suillus spraguei]|nr:rab-GTPase-TBC domain-containing protein [Suillus spraguei]
MAQPRSSTRPPQHMIRNVYDQLFHHGSSLSKLRDAIAAGRLLQSSDGGISVPGRSLAWKLFLLKNALRAHRKRYSELLLEKMCAPDGSYDETFVVPGLTISKKNAEQPTDLETNNPLSLHDENPWREWFAAVDLRKTIQQDVERTFPDIGYFRDDDVQQQLTNILFLYAVMHPDIEYRQGMHELLAPVYYAVDYDSTADDATSSLDESVFRDICSRTWIAADSWALFCAIMNDISKWYEWREPSTSSARGQVNFKPYMSPITLACNHIQNSLLKSVDPILHGVLQGSGIEPQIYGLRWLRLLFTREFSMDDAMILWDGLFASPIPISELVQWTCVAMLIRIRTKLIPSDYSMQLTYLLRYPPSQAEDGALHHTILLLRQASSLEMSRTPSAGAIVMTENRNLLNIPLEVPDPPVQMRRRARPPISSDFHGTSPGQGEHMRQSPSFQMGLPELIARGLMDRGESLGINKTVMNAVSELRRNLPELAASLVRTPSAVSAPYAAYPLLDEQMTDDKHIEPQNKRLGESITWILSDEDAARSLAYVRDILGGEVKEIDEHRLWGAEEYNKRLEGQSKQEQRSMTTPTNEHLPSQLQREVRKFSLNPSGAPVFLRPTTSVPLHSSSMASKAIPMASSTHNRSQSTGAFTVKPITMQRTPLPVKSDQSPKVRSEVQQHDPLGVLK